MSRAEELPRLLVLTDRSQLHLGRALVRTIEECVGAGLRAVVVREHDLLAATRAALVADLASIDGLAVISSRISDPAADAVHLAADQPAPDGGVRWGRSCHSAAEVRRAAADGASYATLSPYAATSSKPGYGPPLPEGAFADLSLPTYALGGITPANASKARAAGAYGVAVMGEVMRADDPAAVVADLLAVLA
ncbi:thiamine phosphate synthase [Nocardioides immobilis]|uniref:Thiamine phosphate synthase n=1 Tax=Nocardioides immobilis TaxID=2049295 RepID=A0A417XV98_9ACTN|nr:thiamine phosphate synthase [Nocardioides immobilis]RHW24276.1 thiamine phosphate synthase [Nocardioides immobilis]